MCNVPTLRTRGSRTVAGRGRQEQRLDRERDVQNTGTGKMLQTTERLLDTTTRASPRDHEDVSAHSAFGEPAVSLKMWWLDQGPWDD
jgi:hypothetical protein